MFGFNSPLKHVRVAAPCKANWDEMYGSEQVRFCRECNLNVYNLSGMSRAEAESLIADKEGKLCVRYYRRADGTILTRNCPVGLSRLKRRVSGITRAVLSTALGFCAGLGFDAGLSQPAQQSVTMGAMVGSVTEPDSHAPVNLRAAPVRTEKMIMGGIDLSPKIQRKGR